MSTNDNTSSLKSYVDTATGFIQENVGKLTGSGGDQAEGVAKQNKGAAENDLSHAVGKVGPFAATPEGGIHKDSQDRTDGSWNQTVGSAKESLGNLVGHDGLKRAGIEQNQQGKAQEAQGQLTDLGQGIMDRGKGAVGSAAAGLTGNKEEQARYNMMHDDGKAGQRSAEADIQRQA